MSHSLCKLSSDAHLANGLLCYDPIMKFGKVERSSQLNSPLPDFLNTPQIAASLKPAHKPQPRICLGAPVWGKKEWIGQLYPAKTAPRDYLKYYAIQMNSIELNTTFYRIPDQSLVRNWKAAVSEDFKFCPKIYQGISTFERLTEVPDLTRQFCENIKAFDQNLGLCFLQLPPYFGPDRMLILKRWIKLLPQGFPLAMEFRHPGWFQDHSLIESAFEFLSEHRIAPVMTDALGRSDVLHRSLSTSKVLIRFLGNSLDPSDFKRLETWVTALENWFDAGVEELYFFIHQPEENGAIELIQFLVERLNQTYGSRYGIQLQGIDLARSERQIELF